MAAISGHFEEEASALFGFIERIALGAEKGIVDGVDQQGWDVDIFQILAGATMFPVIFCIFEAMDRCGEAIVELREVLDGGNSAEIEGLWKLAMFRGDFGAESFEKSLHVDPILPF